MTDVSSLMQALMSVLTLIEGLDSMLDTEWVHLVCVQVGG